MSNRDLIIITIGYVLGNWTQFLVFILWDWWKAKKRKKRGILVTGNFSELFRPGLAQAFRDEYNRYSAEFKDLEPKPESKEPQSKHHS